DEFFPQVMDVAFTRHMEEQLDKIEEQHLDWVLVLNEFYGPFSKKLEEAAETMKHAKAETQPSDYTCPECKKPMVYRFGKNGRFLSCSDYPTQIIRPVNTPAHVTGKEKWLSRLKANISVQTVLSR
ncbi:MAG: topoisomerase DNA-binding C4 zinc finger domain-containing protein, partial [Planctomycetota bacterium]